jgi:hypothetical protein
MSERHISSAPDYTVAALTMMGVNLLWIFFLIWVVYGFAPVVLLALLINHFVDRLAARRGRAPAFAAIRRQNRG